LDRGIQKTQDFTQSRQAAKKKPQRRLRRLLRESVSDARNAVLDQRHIEVDKQAQTLVG
jgi:hypothetical protein